MIWRLERHFPFPYAALQIYATRGCNAENSTFNMKRNFEKDLFFHRRPIERIGQLWIWLHISIRTFPKFPICSVKDFMQFVCLQVCGCLGQRERERERVDPRRKLLIALVVLNCLQPLPKLSGEINIEKHYKIIFKKIQQHIRSADDRSWKDGIHGSDCSLKMSLYSI